MGMSPVSYHRDSLDSGAGRPFLENVSQLGFEDELELTESKLRQRSGMKSLHCHDRTRLAFASMGLWIICATVYLVSSSGAPTWLKLTDMSPTSKSETAPGKPISSSVALRTTNATATFRENLVPSTKYVTTFVSAGFTNQFMEIASLVYLSILTRRVPVVPAFLAEHFSKPVDVAPITFSNIFDLPYLSGKLGIPVVEWHELKQTAHSPVDGLHPEIEKIGCWSTTAGFKNSGPSGSYSTELYGLDISYTPVPETYTLTHGFNPDTYIWSIWGLASLGFTRSRMRVLPDQFRKAFPLQSNPEQKLEPDETMLCWDTLYYTGVFEPYPSIDFFKDYSPYWSQVGVHMRWKQSLIELANQYLRRHFGLGDTDLIPPFISVHVPYDRRVQEVRARLNARTNGTNVREILVTCDERDSAWWKQISAVGPEWRWIDHATEKTSEKYGKWFPLLLDTVFQSMGKGFVGTEQSTMSELARVRVEDWNDGESAMVRWGSPDADNH